MPPQRKSRPEVAQQAHYQVGNDRVFFAALLKELDIKLE